MSVQAEIPHGHPMRDAWEAYKATAEYANTRNWALKEAHVDGSMWAAFCAGYKATPPDAAVGAQGDKCFCDAQGIGAPGVSCGDCPRDYAAPAAVGAQGDGEVRDLETAVMLPAGWYTFVYDCAQYRGKEVNGNRLAMSAQSLLDALANDAAPAAGKGVDDAMVERAAIAIHDCGREFTFRGPWENYFDDYRNRVRDQARAALAAALTRQPVAGDGWRPIESAPRRGREMILLLTPSRFPQVAFSNTWWTAGFSVECKPTHWMRIPDLPLPAAIDAAIGGTGDA